MSKTNRDRVIFIKTGYYSYVKPLPFYKRLFVKKEDLFSPYCEKCRKWVHIYERMLGIPVTDNVFYERAESEIAKSLLAKDWNVLDTAERLQDWILQPAVFIGLGRCESCDGPFSVLGEIHGKASSGTIYIGGLFTMEIETKSGLELLEKAIDRGLMANEKKAVAFCKVLGSTKDFARF